MPFLHSTRFTLIIVAFLIATIVSCYVDTAYADYHQSWLHPKEDIGGQEYQKILFRDDCELQQQALNKILLISENSGKYLVHEKLDKLIDPLIILFNDNKCNNRDLVASALGQIVDEKRISIIVDYIFSKIDKTTTNPVHLYDAVAMISRLDHRAIPYIKKRVENGDINEKRAAVMGVQRMRDPRHDFMLEAMSSPDVVTREKAILGFNVLLSQKYEITDSAISMLYDDNEDIQYYAMELLPSMNIIDNTKSLKNTPPALNSPDFSHSRGPVRSSSAILMAF